MKKWMKLYSIVLCSLFVWSCYDDKGNYDYSDLGEVVLEIENEETVMYGEALEMVPKVTLKRTTEDQYAWAWEVALKTSSSVPEFKRIEETKVLNIDDFREEVGSYDLRFCAIHKASKVETYAYCKLTVDNGLSKVYLLLSQQANGQYDIDAVTHPGGIVRLNQYSLINNEYIPNAEKLFYVNSAQTRDELLYLTQTEGGKTISPIDLAYQGEADGWFFDAPEHLRVSHLVTDYSARDQFMVCDGGIHYMNNVQVPLKASVRCRLDDLDYNITGVGTMHNSSGLGRYAFYDDKNGRFLEWKFAYGQNYLGELTADATAPFDPLKINKRFIQDISGKEDRCWFLFDDGTDMYLYTFKDGAGVYYNVTLVPYEAPVKLDAALRETFSKATAFCALKTADKFYYAVDNVIWIYNASTHKTEPEPFYTDPDANMRFVKIYYRDKDEAEVVFAGNSGDEGHFYRIKVDYTGRLAEPTEKEPEPFKSYRGFGKVKDFVYKYKAVS